MYVTNWQSVWISKGPRWSTAAPLIATTRVPSTFAIACLLTVHAFVCRHHGKPKQPMMAIMIVRYE